MSNNEWILGMDASATSVPAPGGLNVKIGDDNKVTVSWDAVAWDVESGDNIAYSVQVSRFADFRDVSAEAVDYEWESDTSRLITLDKGEYYIRVSSHVEDTEEHGEWSAVVTVYVPTAIATGYEGRILAGEKGDGYIAYDTLSIRDEWISGVTVNRYGSLVINSGKASGIIINSGGQMSLGGNEDYYDGYSDFWHTYAIETVINDGGKMAVRGGYALNTVINVGGEQIVHGVIDNDESDDCNAPRNPILREELVTAYDTVVNGGTQTAIVASISRTTVNSGGLMVLRGGLVDSMTVNSGGVAKLYSYQAESTDGEYNQRPAITYFAGRAANMTVNGGTAYLYDGATAGDTRINSGGVMTVNAGAEVFNTTITVGGSLMVLGSGRATDTVLNGGSIHVATGGLIDGVTINSGKLYLYGGAILDGTVNVNGTVILDDVTMNRGTLNLQLASASGTSPMINDLSRLEGGELTITVTAAQAAGTYVLAGNAAQYSQGISLKTNSGTLGTLMINGDALNWGAYRYRLSLSSDSDLTLQVGSSIVLAKPGYSVSTTEPTNQDVEIIADFSNDAAIREYSFDGQSWSAYQGKIILSDNGSVYFREGDGLGNYGPVASCTVTNIDKIAPEKPQLSVSTQEPTYDAVSIAAVFSADSVRQEYSLDGRNWQTYSKPVSMTGNGTVYFRGTDAAGNTAVTQYEVSNILSVSPDAPSTVSLARSSYKKYNIALKWDKATTANKSIKITGYEISINGVTYTSKSTSFSLKNVDLGSYECMVRAVDDKGNIGRWSDAMTFTAVDETAPVVKITSVSVSGYDLALGWNGSDKKGGIVSYSVKYDGTVRETLSGDASSVTLALSESDVGKHRIEVIAFDGVNYSKAASKSVTIKDATPPERVTGLSIPVADSKYKATLSWNTGTDNSGKVARYEILLDNGKILKSNKTVLSVSKLSVGEHTYQVRAIDQAKNVGEWSEVQTFTVCDVTAPNKVSSKAKVSENWVGIDWKEAKDNVGVTAYEVWFGDSKTDMQLAYQLEADRFSCDFSGIDKGTWYYGVVAIDAAGNRSTLAASKLTVKQELETAIPVDLSAFSYQSNEQYSSGLLNLAAGF